MVVRQGAWKTAMAPVCMPTRRRASREALADWELALLRATHGILRRIVGM